MGLEWSEVGLEGKVIACFDGAQDRRAMAALIGERMDGGRAEWALDLVEWLNGWRGAMARHLRGCETHRVQIVRW